MENENLILEMKGICKYFPGVKALQDVDFFVRRGEVHCLIGANGAGKSTLMKILSGAYHADKGEIIFDGEKLTNMNPTKTREKGIAMVYQELTLVNDLTVAENLFINNFSNKNSFIKWNDLYKKAKELLDNHKISIDPKSLIRDLSTGQRQLVEIMRCVAANSKIIIMDEPSATLSQNEFHILVDTIGELKAKGITIIYISHRLDELFIVGDRITILKNGMNVSTCDSKEITKDQLVKFMVGRTISVQRKPEEKRIAKDEKVLDIQHLGNSKVKDVSFHLKKSEILGFYGLVGSGRTEVIRAIYGADKYTNGKIFVSGKLVNFKNSIPSAIKNGIGLLPENRKAQGLVLPLPVYENNAMVAIKKYVKNGFIQYKSIYRESDEYIDKLQIKTPSSKTMVRSLSGGNQQKVIIAKWLAQNSDILLVDEPTQGIDVGAKDEIYKLLQNCTAEGKSVLIVSSELEELLQVCDRIIVMFEGSIVKEFDTKDCQENDVLEAAIVGR